MWMLIDTPVAIGASADPPITLGPELFAQLILQNLTRAEPACSRRVPGYGPLYLTKSCLQQR
jgi:hypothetical protein